MPPRILLGQISMTYTWQVILYKSDLHRRCAPESDRGPGAAGQRNRRAEPQCHCHLLENTDTSAIAQFRKRLIAYKLRVRVAVSQQRSTLTHMEGLLAVLRNTHP
jgi:hypothetical protein